MSDDLTARVDALDGRVTAVEARVVNLAPTVDVVVDEPTTPTGAPTPDTAPVAQTTGQPADASPLPGGAPPAVDQGAVLAFLGRLMRVLGDEESDVAALRLALAGAPPVPPGSIDRDTVEAVIANAPANIDPAEGADVVIEATETAPATQVQTGDVAGTPDAATPTATTPTATTPTAPSTPSTDAPGETAAPSPSPSYPPF